MSTVVIEEERGNGGSPDPPPGPGTQVAWRTAGETNNRQPEDEDLKTRDIQLTIQEGGDSQDGKQTSRPEEEYE